MADSAAAPVSASFALADRVGEGAVVKSATVKNVLSGDTLVVIADEDQKKGPPVDKIIALASSRAPTMGRPETRDRPATKDDPFAWQSREFLRKLVIGQRIQFITEFVDPKSGREYCSVYHKGEHVGVLMASEGWITVIPPSQKHQPRADQAEMIRLAEEAVKLNKGIHNTKERKNAVRTVSTKFSTHAFYEKHRGKLVDAVVDQVRNGSTVRVVVVGSFEYLTVRFAGVQSPFAPQGQEEPPFTREAKAIIEQVLLGRDVQLALECIDKADGVFSRVLCGGRDPAELLLQTGLARVVEWNAPKACLAKYKEIEEKAHAGRVRIWSLAQAAGPSSQKKDAGYTVGTVREITNGCGIRVVDENGKELVANLASLIIPRQTPNGDEPWSWEAKDTLRNKLMGKQVKVVLDYVRPANDQYPEKAFHSVFLGNTNVAMLLLEKGYAKLINHRQNDPRSSSYSALLNVEQKAQAKSKGVHGPADKAPAHNYTDLSRKPNVKKVQQFLHFLQQPARQTASVEYVFGGDKVKLYNEKATCMINYTLTGIRCPRNSKENPEPCAAEVVAFAKNNLLQRNVEIEAASVDKGGSVIGKLYTSNGNDFGLELVKRGFASVHGSAEKIIGSQAYFQAESQAKAGRLGIWRNWKPEDDSKQEEKEETPNNKKLEWIRIKVTEVVDGGTLYVQRLNQLSQLEKMLADINSNLPARDPHYVPAVKTMILIPFGKEYHRAKVTGISKDKKEFEVFYVDFGNYDYVPKNVILSCPAQFEKIAPFATRAELAYVIPPSLDEEFGNDAAYTVKNMVWDRDLVATIEREENGTIHVVIGDPESNSIVNNSMVHSGFCRVARTYNFKAQTRLPKLREEEEHARKAHLGIWQYGDIPDDDLDEPEMYKKK
uniref:Micrococcal nuclease n=1 Tax=Paramoeba aestuarina TaxID=180227 RepID=A0A7S4L8Z8_9EUKA|eukprot:CAMPEP_0201512400 /NCGR_PEP_ID=MMETSP0161_2-20130828/4661_1 /ASSEMBLY_ACC=CAM_ASM_000251 /TAXON_ID=180227 /ORGANISM="Neoparamoeba aestuarina, Strain SoJaBio B1-5/56/2" /LENGTH=887 /DNA_ID=CAMNT_0047908235 /DNA_START=19 /DNA_END=2682 /DNA_ORIENTATION=-